MARIAIISDLHSNIEALDAVFARIDKEGVDQVLCLGDVVGYGPDPERCLDRVRNDCALVLCGNHDEAVLQGAQDFNPVARAVIEYNRRMLKPSMLSGALRRARWKFIEALPATHRIGDYLLVHGSPRDPIHEYIMKPDVIFIPDKIRDIFERFEGLCFVGHTHFPGVFTDDLRFLEPADVGGRYEWQGDKAIVNVGSVGQPRDSDPRASFVLVEDGLVTFVRVDYDIARVQRKIFDNPNIPDFCGHRLAIGR